MNVKVIPSTIIKILRMQYSNITQILLYKTAKKDCVIWSTKQFINIMNRVIIQNLSLLFQIKPLRWYILATFAEKI